MTVCSCEVIEGDSEFFLMFVQPISNQQPPNRRVRSENISIQQNIGIYSRYDFAAHTFCSSFGGKATLIFLWQSQFGSLAVRHGTLSLPGDYALIRAGTWAACI